MKYIWTAWAYLRSFAVIFLCLWAGRWTVSLLSLPLPDSIVGMMLLFAALSFKMIPEEWVAPAANLFVRYMMLLFVPVSVGVMVHYNLIVKEFIPIVVSCIISSLLVLLIVSLGIHFFEGKHPMRKNQGKL